MNRRRRNSWARNRRSSVPYNQFYDCFRTTFSSVFADRVAEGQRSHLYVPVPHLEQRISEYINGTRDFAAIMHGLMGSGKTSILERCAADDRARRVYLDFSGRRHGMPDWTIDFVESNKDDRRLRARAAVSRRLNDLLVTWCAPHKDRINQSFYDFMLKYHAAELGPAALVANRPEQQARLIERFFENPDITAAVRCLIEYVARIEGYDHFLVIVDNVDEQALETVEAIFFALSDLVACLSRARMNSDGTPSRLHNVKFRAILACRTHTFDVLYSERHGIIHTRGYKEIEVKGPSILPKILSRRVDSIANTPAIQEEAYTLSSGARVVREDALAFVRNFCDYLSRHAIDERLYALLNYDYSWLLRHLKCFIQNRYFFDYDSIMLSHPDAIASPYSLSRILRSMGYGNPYSADALYYPAASSHIPNLLQWDVDNPDTFFAILKFCWWLRIGQDPGQASDFGCRVIYAQTVLSTDYGIDEGASRWALDYMHSTELVFAGAGRGAELSEEDVIYLAPRTPILLDLLYESSLIFEMYIDDICPPDGKAWLLKDRPPVTTISTYPKRFRFEDTLKWLKAIGECEKSYLDRIGDRSATYRQNTLGLFGGHLIAKHLLSALRHSVDVVYRDVVTNEHVNELEAEIAEMERAAALPAAEK